MIKKYFFDGKETGIYFVYFVTFQRLLMLLRCYDSLLAWTNLCMRIDILILQAI